MANRAGNKSSGKRLNLPVTPTHGARSLDQRGCCREAPQSAYKCPTELKAKAPKRGKEGCCE
jgi:hypothetical protein